VSIDDAQRQVLVALLSRHPAMVPADELRVELADVHDIDQALTALIGEGVAMRLGELVGASWVAARTHRLLAG
jgi:hypothetical protein